MQAGGGTATPALIAGSVQFSSSSGSAITAILRGAKLKVVMTLAVSLPWKLWATSPEIRTLTDLEGKPVGAETTGGLDELAMRAALMKAGLPQDYVAYNPVASISSSASSKPIARGRGSITTRSPGRTSASI